MAILTPVIFRQNASPELSRRQQHSFGGDMSDKDLTQPQQASLLCLPAVTEECVLNVALSQTQSGYPGGNG